MISNEKPALSILRIDKRHLIQDLSAVKLKRVKLEPSYLSASDHEETSDVPSIIAPPARVSYLPDGRIPTPPQPPAQVSTDLCPPTPSIIVESYDEAMSPELQQYCLSHPICVVRGLTRVLQLDLGLYSTKTLLATQPDHQIEVRTQLQQASDENFDYSSSHSSLKNIWKCESSRSYTTISKYAQYQALSFEEMIRERNNQSMTPTNKSNHTIINGNSKKINHYTNGHAPGKTIRFGTNLDLSDEKKWPDQLSELNKLPPFMRVVSLGNLLSHIGYTILGMNSVQLYMKVPGSRTPGHQENNNFCSININIGPGDCEWFGTAKEYWGVIHTLCEKNGVNYLKGSWWPILEELYESHVPVYRFIQKPGDVVFVNTGCVHWVQAIGWCNNIAWNVGPLTFTQYYAAIERYEWNKLGSCKSIVPMIHLSWNIARNMRISDRPLFDLIQFILGQSLRYVKLVLKYLDEQFNSKLILRKQLRTADEPAHYCLDCDCEVFNLLFVSEQDRKHVVRCLDCALQFDEDFHGVVVLYQFNLDDLQSIYDRFQFEVLPGKRLIVHK